MMATTFAPGGVPTMAEPVPALGFDAAASPAWLMVPADPVRSKKVMLTGGAGLSLQLAKSAQTGIVTFKEQSSTAAGRPIVITGVRPGTVRLEAQDTTGAARATLEITVKAQKKLATFIHFVFDKSGRSTKKGLTEALEIIRVANVLLAQANVMMFRRDSGGFNLPFDLERGVPILELVNTPPTWIETPGPWPRCISKDPPGPQGCMPPAIQGSLSPQQFNKIRINNVLSNILSHADPYSDFNIFFVDKLDDPSSSKFPTGAFTLFNDNGVALNCCILPSVSAGHALAHEVGHFLLNGFQFLTKTGHTMGQFDLMVESPNDQQIKIPKQQANFMNPSGFP